MTNGLDKNNWKKVTFGEMCRNLNTSEKDPLGNGLDRYVGLEHIETNDLHIKSWGYVAEGTTFTKRFSRGHVLFGKRRSYLRKAAIADFDGICSGDILVFEANEKIIHPRLFPFVVSSDRFLDYAIQTSAGSLSPRTKFQDLAKLEFLLPPKERQGKLVELLWASDKLVQKYQWLLSKKVELKQTYIDFFQSNLDSSQFVQHLSLSEIGEFKNGINKGKEDFGFGSPFVNLLDVFGKEILKSDEFQLVNVSKDELINFNLQKGDLLFVRSSVKPEGVGLTILINEDLPNTVFSGFLIRFRPTNENVNSTYLQYAFRSLKFRNELLKNSTVSANTNINQSSLNSLSIMVPHTSIQIDFIKKMEHINIAIHILSEQLKRSLLIQKELINQIFS